MKQIVKQQTILSEIIDELSINNNTKNECLKHIASKISKVAPTLLECRVPIFAPILKASPTSDLVKEFKKGRNIRKMDTKWGKGFVRGRCLLTQLHRDILDSVLACAKLSYMVDKMTICASFSAREVLRYYNENSEELNSGSNGVWLLEMLKQIRDTTIEIEVDGFSVDFNILHKVAHSEDGSFCHIEFDPSYIALYRTEMVVCHKEILPDIIACKSAVVKAIIRSSVTHDDMAVKLETMLERIGYKIDREKQDQKWRRIKNEILENKRFLDAIGIELNEKDFTFCYKGNERKVLILEAEVTGSERDKELKALSDASRKNEKAKRTKVEHYQSNSLFDGIEL
ncbi:MULTISPECIES: hypothetical protein [unclassified Helicobacter]|uniref:hypothetical protein n=1 Tax=unclassified Helicobacter TaxID=2593540 RepID=UPI0015F1AA5B|nr:MULTISPECIES: hypothetical protein [unclassified Helicobacter]